MSIAQEGRHSQRQLTGWLSNHQLMASSARGDDMTMLGVEKLTENNCLEATIPFQLVKMVTKKIMFFHIVNSMHIGS